MQQRDQSNIHNIALNSSLFKGHYDLYYCYLKSEKIALALARIFARSNRTRQHDLDELLRQSKLVPEMIVELAAGTVPPAAVMGGIFKVRTQLQIIASAGLLSEDNATLILQEYTNIIGRMRVGADVPALTLSDIAVPEFSYASDRTKKGHTKRQAITAQSKGHDERAEAILKIVNENKRVSIKDIAKTVRDCSEKTIQRELISLMQQGLVRKEGERRWSVYLPMA